MFRNVGFALLAAGLTACAALASIPEQRVAGFVVQGSPAIRKAALGCGLARDLGQPLTDLLVMRGVERLKRIGRAAAVKVDFRQEQTGTWITYRVRENPKISAIEFRGNTLVTASELLAELEIRPGQVLDYDALYREVNRIPGIYLKRKGVLYSGVVSPAAIEADAAGKVRIDIQEFKLKRLEVRGVRGRLKDAVLASLPLRRGQVLRRADLLGGLFNVYQLPQVSNVDYRPVFDREKGEITLVLNLKGSVEGDMRLRKGPLDSGATGATVVSPSSRGKLH